jgi:hypothetical protein
VLHTTLSCLPYYFGCDYPTTLGVITLPLRVCLPYYFGCAYPTTSGVLTLSLRVCLPYYYFGCDPKSSNDWRARRTSVETKEQMAVIFGDFVKYGQTYKSGGRALKHIQAGGWGVVD